MINYLLYAKILACKHRIAFSNFYVTIIKLDFILNVFYILRALLGKVPTLLLRLSCILQSLHDSFNYIMGLVPEKRFKLDDKFEKDLNEHFKTHIETEINLESVKKAYNLLEYFNKNKLVLAGYTIDSSLEIEEIFDLLIQEMENGKSIEIYPIESIIIKEIIESNEFKVSLTGINSKLSRKCTMAMIHSAVKLLIEHKFGKSISDKNLNGPPTKFFQKIFIAEICIDKTLFLQNHGVDLNVFKRLYDQIPRDTSSGNKFIKQLCFKI